MRITLYVNIVSNKNSFVCVCSYDDLKPGTLVGEDKYGNKYFENPYYFYGRNRWVQFAEHVRLEYDASQIPAEWYGWMHYKVNTFDKIIKHDAQLIYVYV